MNRDGHNKIKSAIVNQIPSFNLDLGVRVTPDPDAIPGTSSHLAAKECVRFVTITPDHGLGTEFVLNALDKAHLMHKGDSSEIQNIPDLKIHTIGETYVVLEDLAVNYIEHAAK